MTHTSQKNRRAFLKNMGLAGSAAILAPVLPKQAKGQRSALERPVFATIGLRNQGWAITQKTLPYADFAALADVDAKVLADNVEKVAQKQSRKPDAYGDYRRILERDDIDAVMIATPDHWHTKICVEAMLAGKDVYCEKPLTLTIDEGKLIEEVVSKTGQVCQVGTMQRTECGQLFLRAIALIRAGRIGKVKKITCGIGGMPVSPKIPVAKIPEEMDWDFWLGPAPETDYRALPKMREGYGGGVPLYSNAHYAFRNWHEYSGGKMTDWGAHHVDIACWALGKENAGPDRITPVDFELGVPYKNGMPTEADRYNVATSFQVKVDMPDDVEMIITSEGDNGILFEGSKGRFFVNRGKLVGKPVEELSSHPLPDDAVEQVYGGKVSANHSLNFIESVKQRTNPVSDVWSHNQMLEICHLANIAMRLNRPLKWDAVNRTILDDEQASTFLTRDYRQGFQIQM
ncbi:MAG: Gfo/Idh/MocA family oxidoreductase [Pirellulaceae bacterium]|nr:Gfo/Idh/MocA family oxidoreductase [Pirellulaceae bacterium]MDG2105478.1 Gfo/Idh/MocA family oxidoreductase [Pirellulaceae bacterium]